MKKMILRMIPNSSGAYQTPDRRDIAELPEGYAVVLDTFDMTDFYASHGFGTATFTDNTLTTFVPDMAAWEAWKAEHPESEPQLDDMTAVQLAVAELAETQANDQTANELALAELAEMIGG